MTTTSVRQQLHQQIDNLPDDLVQIIADFAAFMVARRGNQVSYDDWEDQQWQNLALCQFIRESDDVEYTLNDAQEVFTDESG